MTYTRDSININPEEETDRIITKLKKDVGQVLKKRGVVVGISGGVDSSVVLALCAKAFGSQRVLGLIMPEKDSSPDSQQLAINVASQFNVDYKIEDMTDAIVGLGCYKRRDEAIKRIFPEYDNSYKAKITLPSDIMQKDRLNLFYLTIISPDGEEKTERMPIQEYLQIVAASNFKQRSRMCMLYYYAESHNYAVVGTGNKNEHGQGFFVKYGDGGVDVRPIVHLLKTQIYQLADYLDIPQEIIQRVPTSDTYSAEQTQEEFFFRAPFEILDRVWFGLEKGYSAQEIAQGLDLKVSQVENIIHDIERKQRTTEYLRMTPL